MTEAYQVWEVTRDHVAPYGRFKRIENLVDIGTPDVAYTLMKPRGVQGWLELKLFPHTGRCPKHFTREQLLWGEAEVKAGGRWRLFGRCGPDWIMYDSIGARALFEGERPLSPRFQVRGQFPLAAFLRELAL